MSAPRSEPQRHGTAAPPDDGHMGSFSRPDEELDVAHEPNHGPELSYEAHRTGIWRSGARQVFWLLVFLLVSVPLLWHFFTR